MLQKEKPTPWSEHPVNLGQSLVYLLDAAQRERADHAIEPAVLERQSLASQNALLHVDSSLLDSPLRQPLHPHIRINSRELANTGRITRQIQPRTEADLQNLSSGVCE